MSATRPPFRAEHVGSLLRPLDLRQARLAAATGKLSAEDLRGVEDRAIRAAVAKQEALGLEVVSDGEYRRDFWHLDFLRQLAGVGVAGLDGLALEGGWLLSGSVSDLAGQYRRRRAARLERRTRRDG